MREWGPIVDGRTSWNYQFAPARQVNISHLFSLFDSSILLISKPFSVVMHHSSPRLTPQPVPDAYVPVIKFCFSGVQVSRITAQQQVVKHNPGFFLTQKSGGGVLGLTPRGGYRGRLVPRGGCRFGVRCKAPVNFGKYF